jgi:hypothetical protein
MPWLQETDHPMVWIQRTDTDQESKIGSFVPVQATGQCQRSNSQTYQDEPNNITAAVCFKTLFGNIDIGLVLQWVGYNAVLGIRSCIYVFRPGTSPHLPNSRVCPT